MFHSIPRRVKRSSHCFKVSSIQMRCSKIFILSQATPARQQATINILFHLRPFPSQLPIDNQICLRATVWRWSWPKWWGAALWWYFNDLPILTAASNQLIHSVFPPSRQMDQKNICGVAESFSRFTTIWPLPFCLDRDRAPVCWLFNQATVQLGHVGFPPWKTNKEMPACTFKHFNGT